MVMGCAGHEGVLNKNLKHIFAIGHIVPDTKLKMGGLQRTGNFFAHFISQHHTTIQKDTGGQFILNRSAHVSDICPYTLTDIVAIISGTLCVGHNDIGSIRNTILVFAGDHAIQRALQNDTLCGLIPQRKDPFVKVASKWMRKGLPVVGVVGLRIIV